MLKKCLIGLAIYTVVAIGIMFGMIYYHNANADQTEWNLNSNLIVGKGSDPYGTYDQNDLVINDVDMDYKGFEFRISQISGLKDDKIENKINQDIKKTIFDYVDKYNTDNIYVSPYSNFGNTISFFVSCYSDDEKSHYKGLNYNLITGEKLKFEDLFCDNANYAKVFYTGLFDESSRDEYWDALDEFYSSDPDEYFNDEDFIACADDDQIYRDVKKYLAKMDELDFAFSENYVLLVKLDGEGLMNIRFDTIKDIVNIFDKYKTTFSIYEEDGIGAKGVINFSGYHPDGQSDKFGFIGDNVFVDSTYNDGTYYDEDFQKADPKYFELFNKELNERRVFVDDTIKKAKSDKNNFYIIFDHLNSYIASDSTYNEEANKWDRRMYDICEFNIYSNVYVIPKDVYNNEYKDILYDGYRKGNLGFGGDRRLSYDYDDDGNIIPEKYGTLNNYDKVYNYMQGIEITELAQIFNDDYDYKNALFNTWYGDFINAGYDLPLEEVQTIFENCTFDISSYGVDIHNDDYDDVYSYMSYSQFEDGALNFK